MRNTFIVIMLMGLSALSSTACSENAGTMKVADGADDKDEAPIDYQIKKTTPVPSKFFSKANQQGKVERLEYTSKTIQSLIDLPRISQPTSICLTAMIHQNSMMLFT